MLNSLAKKAFESEYFIELMNKVENLFCNDFLNLNQYQGLSETELNDVLRFADIFSSCEISQYRNLANKVISLLHPRYFDNETYKSYAVTVLTKMGLFPSINIISGDVSDLNIPNDVLLLNSIKQQIQKDRFTNITYTDRQYEVIKSLYKKNHYSLSAPTSFGKTMIIRNFINELIHDNFIGNICIIVPTNALLKEVSQSMIDEYEKKSSESEIKNSIKVISYPEVKEKDMNSDNIIFVFTPERLQAYYSNKNNPEIEYVFVDEAQKMIRINDERTPVYYNVISYAAFKGAKLYFLSPNIEKPEVFLNLAGRDTDNVKEVKDKLVTQNRFIFDYSNNKVCYLNFKDEIVENSVNLNNKNLDEAIKDVYINNLNETPTLVYFSSKAKMFDTLMDYIENMEDVQDEELNALIKKVETTVHEKYYLIRALKKGIAFHYGQMPKAIREKIEEFFKNKKIKILFTTSTLLEGVNIQAKNIILTSESNGLSNLTQDDFLNLIGRAGRFKDELYGNIVCLRGSFNKDRSKYRYFDSQYVSELNSEIIDSTRGNFYKDIKQLILKKEPISKNLQINNVKSYNIRQHYANIAIFHNKIKYYSKLNENLTKVTKDISIFKSLEKELQNAEKLRIFSENIDIPILYQSNVYESDTAIKFKQMFINRQISDVDYAEILFLLNEIYISYELYERRIVQYKNSYRYYASLVNEWINGKPVNVIIKNTIKWFEDEKSPFLLDVEYIEDNRGKSRKNFNKYVGSDKQINLIINSILEDLENIVKHVLKNYISNYIKLNIENGSLENRFERIIEYVEFGTKKEIIIELQKFGFSRELANYVSANHYDCLKIENGELIAINFYKLFLNFDNKSEMYLELEEYKYLIV